MPFPLFASAAEKMTSTPDAAVLVLADGTVFRGRSIGARGAAVGEVVFNTAITGYQEILTDPSYCRQLVALTHPHIGNTGVNGEDRESSRVYAEGLIVRDLPRLHSSWRAQGDLGSYLKDNHVAGIADIDTRKLTRILRTKGAQSGCVMAGSDDPEAALAQAKAFPGMAGLDLAKVVSTREPGKLPSLLQGRLDVAFAGPHLPHETAALRALGAKDPGQPPRVDVGDRRNAVLLQVRAKVVLRAPARMQPRQVADHQPGGVDLRGLVVLPVHAGVADVRVGQGDDLAAVRGIGEDLLVAGHRRIEDDLPDRGSGGADGAAAEHRSVGENEHGGVLNGSHLDRIRKAGKACEPLPLH